MRAIKMPLQDFALQMQEEGGGEGGLMCEGGRMTTGACSQNVGKVIIRTQVGNR